ncbi:hypothetical protein [Lichenicoccus sp.]|uniref:hypothetical protein n=1 Tax=Lichenicoccus sp. TaxID=2781899 RepID=UPI003D10D995
MAMAKSRRLCAASRLLTAKSRSPAASYSIRVIATAILNLQSREPAAASENQTSRLLGIPASQAPGRLVLPGHDGLVWNQQTGICLSREQGGFFGRFIHVIENAWKRI